MLNTTDFPGLSDNQDNPGLLMDVLTAKIFGLLCEERNG